MILIGMSQHQTEWGQRLEIAGMSNGLVFFVSSPFWEGEIFITRMQR